MFRNFRGLCLVLRHEKQFVGAVETTGVGSKREAFASVLVAYHVLHSFYLTENAKDESRNQFVAEKLTIFDE